MGSQISTNALGYLLSIHLTLHSRGLATNFLIIHSAWNFELYYVHASKQRGSICSSSEFVGQSIHFTFWPFKYVTIKAVQLQVYGLWTLTLHPLSNCFYIVLAPFRINFTSIHIWFITHEFYTSSMKKAVTALVTNVSMSLHVLW